MRENKSPVQKYSQKQIDTRKIMKDNSKAFRKLSETNIKAWNDAGKDWKVVNRFGDLRELAGNALFIRLNNNIKKVGGGLIEVPPEPVKVSGIESLECTFNYGVLKVEYTSSSDLENEMILFEFTRSLNKGVNYNRGLFRAIDFETVDATKQFNLQDEYVAWFGEAVINQKIFCKATIVNKITGQTGISWETSCTVTGTNIYETIKNNTVAWYDYLDLLTIKKDAAEKVKEWRDKLLSGHDLLQITDIKKPIYSIDGVLFDGVNDNLKALGFVYEQPEMIYMVVKQVSWTIYDRIFDGNNDARCLLRLSATTPAVNAYAGVSSSANFDLVLYNFAIVRLLFNGVDSKLQINKNSPTAGNFGNNDSNGYTLASNGNPIKDFANIQVKEVILRDIEDTSEDEEKIYDYLKTKYGL